MTNAALVFTITFHSRFRVGAASGRDGLDLTVDHDLPLHGDHLKGLMRAQADALTISGMLGADGETLTAEIFGTPKSPSLWTWTPAHPTPDWTYAVRHRVAIDADTYAAKKDHIVRAEAVWAPQATFGIEWRGNGQPSGHHSAVLRLSACSVHHIGAWRRRGLGWVGVTADGDRAVDLQTLKGMS